MEPILYLFRVTLQGMTYASAGNRIPGISYVVAQSCDEAYQKVKASLTERGVGFTKDRILHTIELIADTQSYGDTLYQLYL